MKTRKEYNEQYYLKNKKKCNEQQKQYRAENSEKEKARKKKWYKENSEKVLERHKQLRLKNPGHKKEYNKQYYLKNSEEQKEYQRQWRLKNPEYIKQYCLKNSEKRRRWKLKNNYNMTLEQYQEKLTEQFSGCPICNITIMETGKTLIVDHNHKTGKTRGLICRNCNSAIGLLKDDPKIVKNALTYLEKYYEKKIKTQPAEKNL